MLSLVAHRLGSVPTVLTSSICGEKTVTVALSAGDHAAVSLLEITSNDGLTVYGSVDPTTDSVPVSLKNNRFLQGIIKI